MNCCPDCGWNLKTVSRNYQVDDYSIIFKLEQKDILNPPLKNKEVYPIINDFWKDSSGFFSWREIHFCPICRKEFEFMNGCCEA